MTAEEQGTLWPERRKVLMDMDDCLALMKEALMPMYNERHQTSYTTAVFSSWNKWDFPCSYDEFMEIYHELWSKNWHRVKPSIFKETLWALMDRHDVEIVTHRPDKSHEGKLVEWLDMYFPGMKLKIIITDGSAKKLELGHDIIFDDAVPLTREFSKNGNGDGKVLYLIDKPYNGSPDLRALEDGKRIIRASNLAEGISHLLRADSRSMKPVPMRTAEKSRSRMTA